MNKKQIIIWLLACFLITYHTLKIYTGLAETGNAGLIFSEGYYQNTVRLWIITSLLLVIMFKRLGVYSMWLSIFALVVIQYVLLPGNVNLAGYFGPLKGFIIPLIITWLFWRQGEQTASRLNVKHS